VIERARQLCFADALSLAAAGLCAAGMVVTGDGLVAAAQRSPSAAALSWHDRLLLGLWTFRLEHALWFTLGLVLLWVGLGLGGRLGSYTEPAIRLAGGVATGYVLLAAAVMLGSTLVALAGSVGAGSLEVSFSGRERLATWLLQALTAAAMAIVWALAGSRLGERFAIARGDAAGEVEPDQLEDEFDDGRGQEPEPLGGPPPPPQPAVSPGAAEPIEALPAVTAAVPAGESPTPAARARSLYAERLSFSPMRDEARALVEQVVTAERAGEIDKASSLADRLAAM
jgi:hypothetical protein